MPKRYFSKLLESQKNEIEDNPVEPTWGLAVPRQGSKQACLCADKETYSRKCCERRLINQGIGSVTGEAPPITAFHKPSFSNAFA